MFRQPKKSEIKVSQMEIDRILQEEKQKLEEKLEKIKIDLNETKISFLKIDPETINPPVFSSRCAIVSTYPIGNTYPIGKQPKLGFDFFITKNANQPIEKILDKTTEKELAIPTCRRNKP